MKLILHFLQMCLRNNEPAFWAKISDEHQIHALLIDMDVLCAEFIPRLFRGARPLCQGLQCRAAVTGSGNLNLWEFTSSTTRCDG